MRAKPILSTFVIALIISCGLHVSIAEETNLPNKDFLIPIVKANLDSDSKSEAIIDYGLYAWDKDNQEPRTQINRVTSHFYDSLNKKRDARPFASWLSSSLMIHL